MGRTGLVVVGSILLVTATAHAQCPPGQQQTGTFLSGTRADTALAGFAGGAYLVLWLEHDQFTTQERALVGAVARDGTVTSTASFALPTLYDARSMQLVSGGASHLWLDTFSETATVELLSTTGAPIGLARAISSSAGALAASSDGARYAVTWAEKKDAQGRFTAELQRFTDGGAPIDAAPIAIAATDFGGAQWTGSARTGAVTWVVFMTGTGIQGVRVDDSGAVLDATPVAFGAADPLVIASLGDQALLIAGDGAAPLQSIVFDATGVHAPVSFDPGTAAPAFALRARANDYVLALGGDGDPRDNPPISRPLIAIALARDGTLESIGAQGSAIAGGLATDGDGFALLSVDERDTADAGTSSVELARYDAAGAAIATTTVVAHDLVSMPECFGGPDDSEASCNAAGASPSWLVALALVLWVRLGRARGARPARARDRRTDRSSSRTGGCRARRSARVACRRADPSS
jgi:hypothetical protein